MKNIEDEDSEVAYLECWILTNYKPLLMYVLVLLYGFLMAWNIFTILAHIFICINTFAELVIAVIEAIIVVIVGSIYVGCLINGLDIFWISHYVTKVDDVNVDCFNVAALNFDFVVVD